MSGSGKPLRLVVVVPSWLGDAVMATPALRLIRRALPGTLVGGLVRPGIEQVFAGSDLFDELHVAHWGGVMGPKRAAQKIRHARYDTAVLFTNSFSTALAIRMAGVPRRVGYDRDLRGLLLTDKLSPPKREDGAWAVVPAVRYYTKLVRRALLHEDGTEGGDGFLELGTTAQEEAAGAEILSRAGADAGARLAILNPGGNNPAKRWPGDRFAALAAWLAAEKRMTVLVNGSPGEAELVRGIVEQARGLAPGGAFAGLSDLGITIGSLKAIVKRSKLMVTNDTGPRHLAAAFGVPVVTMFGPTDHRWTTIPTRPGGPEKIILADPTLPETEAANDHPERCRIERIELETVRRACAELLLAPFE